MVVSACIKGRNSEENLLNLVRSLRIYSICTLLPPFPAQWERPLLQTSWALRTRSPFSPQVRGETSPFLTCPNSPVAEIKFWTSVAAKWGSPFPPNLNCMGQRLYVEHYTRKNMRPWTPFSQLMGWGFRPEEASHKDLRLQSALRQTHQLKQRPQLERSSPFPLPPARTKHQRFCPRRESRLQTRGPNS